MTAILALFIGLYIVASAVATGFISAMVSDDDSDWKTFSVGQKIGLLVVAGPICWFAALIYAIYYSAIRPLVQEVWNYLGQIGPSK